MKVSNSMMMSAQTCEKRFEFEHIYQIRPKEFPEAMERGLAGHSMMEAFFLKMQEGGTYEQCVEAVNELLPQWLGTSKVEIYRHVLAFGAYVFQQGWKVVTVEVNRLHPLDLYVNRGGEEEEIEFAFTADVLFEWTSGPRKGYRFMIDFKFTGQYWTDHELAVYQQLPKYVLYTNEMFPDDIQIRHAGLVMLNTRASKGATGQQLFMLKWLNLDKMKLANVKKENESLALQTSNLRARLEAGGEALRTVNTYTCKMCFFAKDVCPMQLEGRDITRTIERNYIHNTYFDDNYGEKTPEETVVL